MAEPTTREEYEARYLENYQVTGYGVEGVTNHFPCPFCAAPDWYVVRVVDFGEPTDPIDCKACGRAARFWVNREGGTTTMGMFQTAGDDPPTWVLVPREPDADAD